MRKRTYTAIDEPVSCVSKWNKNLQNVLHTDKRQSSNTDKNESSHIIDEVASNDVVVSPLSVLDTPGSCPVGVTRPDSLRGLKNKPASDPIEIEPSEDDGVPLTTIHNLVGTCEIFSSVQPIDLDYVYHCLPNSYYNRQRFAAITIRVTSPVCTGLLFTSGKLVVTGSKSLIECNLAALKIVRSLERHIPHVSFTVRNAVIQNVVAHVVLPLKPGQKLNVDRLYGEHACNCTFQRNLFPGLIYRPDKSPVVLLCFSSAKIVITGGKKESDISNGWARLWPLIKQYIE